ncbi:MAG TPA: hypothetical protein VFU43_28685 [Streptosporangiaceae bacterium]|nr:hypothetical protein [Streptosporangiaceae bacterium]
MGLTGKDAVTTLVTGVIIAVYVAFLGGTDLPIISSARGTTAVILVLGMIGGCALSGVGEAFSGPRSPATRIFIAIASTIGLVALVAGVIGLITAGESALGVLFGATIALWLVATTRHAFVPVHRPPARHDDVHGALGR